MQTIYIISGPCGVGKSTAAKELAKQVPKSALIHGDDLLHLFDDRSSPPWDEKLAIMWKNILAVTNNLIQHDFNVIIDIVVEDELEWFCRHFQYMNVSFKYIVLRADEELLVERINKRGDVYMIERSLFLLNQLENETSFNQPYLYDTTGKEPADIAKDIIELPKFSLPK
ncbi:AAA family ATPase [Lederbergia lenta]|uniref:Carbohydrate kinase, thermoresistant glucokinase family n=1 Tax=Lederbergia lenta TaxID=1467 RepID=A0A2X4ZCI8_LEDLE|nr:AAA family ATPase [Lederbergia lenta]MEC2323020.1 AAA family ATPase [Lederbergia lenta]SQI62215.1 carbohydrate kinase, thermoresistant glucokinase family [Lederbergia lenta]